MFIMASNSTGVNLLSRCCRRRRYRFYIRLLRKPVVYLALLFDTAPGSYEQSYRFCAFPDRFYVDSFVETMDILCYWAVYECRHVSVVHKNTGIQVAANREACQILRKRGFMTFCQYTLCLTTGLQDIALCIKTVRNYTAHPLVALSVVFDTLIPALRLFN